MKKLQTPKPNMQTELYCLAIHNNTRECTLEYTGVEKQVAENLDFIIFFLLSHPLA